MTDTIFVLKEKAYKDEYYAPTYFRTREQALEHLRTKGEFTDHRAYINIDNVTINERTFVIHREYFHK